MKYYKTPVAFAVTSIMTLPSFAATSTDENIYVLDTITVVSSESNKHANLKKPQAINGVEGDTVKNIGSKNVPAALRILPNVDILGGPTPQSENISIRGLPQSHAYISIDGIYQSNFATKRGSWFLNPNFVNSLQVTAGPTSGSAAGKITIETISAKDLLAGNETFGSKFDFGYRSNNQQKEMGVTVFGIDDNTDYLASFQTSDRQPYHIGNSGPSYDKTRGDQQSGLVKINHQFNSDQALKFTFNTDDSRTYQVRNDIGYRDTKYNGASLVWSDKASGNDLVDLNASFYINYVDSFSWEDEGNNEQGTQDIQDNSIGFTISNDSITDVGLAHYGVSGHFTSHKGEVILSDQTTGAIIEDESAASEASSKSRKLATWVNLQIPVTERLNVIPGIRYDSFYIESSNAIGLDGEPLLRDGRTESRVSMSLNGVYELSSDVKLFASFAQALNPPSNGALFTSGRGFKPNPNLKSERADNKEVGIVFDNYNVFSDTDSLVTRINVFQNDIKDYIADLYSTEWPDGEKVNLGQVSLKGFEISTSYQLNDWDLAASYARTRGRDSNTGFALAEMPSDKINLQTNYALNREWSLGSVTTFAFKHNHAPTQQISDKGVEDIPNEGSNTWFAMDVFASYKPASIKGLSARLSVTNLFDKEYANRLKFERDGSLAAKEEFYEEGRSVNLTVSYQF
ncbi:MAG: TonB-dependent receptor domain-containing protein [Psychrobium sp.]